MELLGNALELRAFDRMEEDIRLVGYFKNKDSERECAAAAMNNALLLCFSWSPSAVSVPRWMGLCRAHAPHFNGSTY